MGGQQAVWVLSIYARGIIELTLHARWDEDAAACTHILINHNFASADVTQEDMKKHE